MAKELMPGQSGLPRRVAADVGSSRGSSSRSSRSVDVLLALKNDAEQTSTYFRFTPTLANFARCVSQRAPTSPASTSRAIADTASTAVAR
jgi:multiple sugar transport system permease protein